MEEEYIVNKEQCISTVDLFVLRSEHIHRIITCELPFTTGQ